MMIFFPRAWKRRVKPSPSPEVAPMIKMVFIEEVIFSECGRVADGRQGESSRLVLQMLKDI